METYIIILKVLFWISCGVCILYALFGKVEKEHVDTSLDDSSWLKADDMKSEQDYLDKQHKKVFKNFLK